MSYSTLSVKNLNFGVEYYLEESQRIVPARIFPPHVDDRLEFYILIDGDASFSVENNVYKLTAGDVVISKPNQIHNCILNSNSVHKHLCFWFDSSCEFLFEKINNLKSNLVSPPVEEKGKLLDIYKELRIARDCGDELKQFTLFVAMIEIIGKYVDKISVQQIVPDILKSVLDDLNTSFTEINSLSYFTEKYSVSSSTLNRLFKQHLNTSPKLYLETKRLAYARILLRKGENVMTACMKAGFTDYSNFIRLFKKRFNVTPNQYKNEK